PATTPTPTETPTTPTPSLTPTVSPTASPSPTPTGFVIDSVESYYGPPGSTLTILGHGFQLTAGSVLVGNFAAPVTLWTDTTIVAQVPTQLSASQLPARVRVIRADGVTNTTINCFIVSPTDPTAVPPAPPTATPIPPSGC
ncbi:MAG: IPT/TIG domain-containing protein, partial [Chloroflexota bacterium]